MKWAFVVLLFHVIFTSCKTVDAPSTLVSSAKGDQTAPTASIYSCSDVIQAPEPSADQPLAGRYVITAFGDAATLTWMGKANEQDIYDAECRYNDALSITTCETFAGAAQGKVADVAPIWTFTIDHAKDNDVRILGFNGKFSDFHASRQQMQFLGIVHGCSAESKR